MCEIFVSLCKAFKTLIFTSECLPLIQRVVEELNALDFVLMFVPIESAFIAALRQDPMLPEYALQKNVSLLSPANFLATASTVASVWQLHNQNTNARQIAERGGRLYDKFKGFADNLKQVEFRMNQAQESFSKAYRPRLDLAAARAAGLHTIDVRPFESLRDIAAAVDAIEADESPATLRNRRP